LSGLSLLFPYEMPLFAKTFAILNSLGVEVIWGAPLATDLTPVQEMQYAVIWHTIVALAMIVVIIGHIYRWGWRAPSTPWAAAWSTATGPLSITGCGSRKRTPRRAAPVLNRMRRRRQPSEGMRPVDRIQAGALILMTLLAGVPVPGMAAEASTGGYASLEGHGGPVKGVAVSPDGTHALTASFDYSVGLWDLRTNTLVRWLEGHEAAVNAVAFLPDGRHAISAGDDFDLILWDLETGRALRRLEGHRGKLIAVSVSPDGRLAASSGWDGVVGLWPLDGLADGTGGSAEGSGNEPVWLKGHRANVNDARFSADGRSLYTASYDGTVRQWDVTTGAMERIVVEHGFGVNHLVLNEEKGWLAYGAVDGAVRAITLDSGAELADLTADRRPILALADSPDGRFLAVGDGEGYIMIIDTDDWTIDRDFHAAVRGPIWALHYDSDGARLLAGGLADEAALWPVGGARDALFAAGRQFHTPPGEMTNGERQFVRKCSICHTLEPASKPGDARRAGPTLHGLFGRPAGSVPGYRYSDGLANSGVVWEAETINMLFELGPDHFTPGSKMPMQRIAKLADRQDLIKYLRDNTGSRTGPVSTGGTE
jgi:cytochrome c